MKIEDISAEELAKGIQMTLTHREKHAQSFRSRVGVNYWVNEEWFPATNREGWEYNVNHAEERGLMRAYDRGNRCRDFGNGAMIEIYQDAGHDKPQLYPGCPFPCWGNWKAWTHPDMLIIVVDVGGKVHGSINVGQILALPSPFETYPSQKDMDLRPLTNSEPRLGKPYTPTVETMQSESDAEPVIRTAIRYADLGVRIDTSGKLLRLDGAALGTFDGKVQGGFPMESWFREGHSPEAFAIACSNEEGGYNGRDYKIFVGVVPEFFAGKEAIPFLTNLRATFSTLLEAGTPEIRFIGVDKKGSRLYDGSIPDLLRKFGEDANCTNFTERLKTERPRQNSQPRSIARSPA